MGNEEEKEKRKVFFPLFKDTKEAGGEDGGINLEGGWRRYYKEREQRQLAERMRKYKRAIRIDRCRRCGKVFLLSPNGFSSLRFSRVAVPLTYISLNVAYWAVYYEALPSERPGMPDCRP